MREKLLGSKNEIILLILKFVLATSSTELIYILQFYFSDLYIFLFIFLLLYLIFVVICYII